MSRKPEQELSAKEKEIKIGNKDRDQTAGWSHHQFMPIASCPAEGTEQANPFFFAFK